MRMHTENPILEARLSLQMRQTEFARALGVSQATVSRWEADKHQISQVVLMAVDRLVEQSKAEQAA